jgi:pyruvate dehydrogenase E1 component
VWSATSYNELYRDANAATRWNMLHPGEKAKVPYVAQCLAKTDGPVIAASDYLKSQPGMLAQWLATSGKSVTTLGTDGFGRSEDRGALRNFFEVDARYVTVATLSALMREGQIEPKVVKQAIKDLGINPDKPNPAVS